MSFTHFVLGTMVGAVLIHSKGTQGSIFVRDSDGIKLSGYYILNRSSSGRWSVTGVPLTIYEEKQDD